MLDERSEAEIPDFATAISCLAQFGLRAGGRRSAWYQLAEGASIGLPSFPMQLTINHDFAISVFCSGESQA